MPDLISSDTTRVHGEEPCSHPTGHLDEKRIHRGRSAAIWGLAPVLLGLALCACDDRHIVFCDVPSGGCAEGGASGAGAGGPGGSGAGLGGNGGSLSFGASGGAAGGFAGAAGSPELDASAGAGDAVPVDASDPADAAAPAP